MELWVALILALLAAAVFVCSITAIRWSKHTLWLKVAAVAAAFMHVGSIGYLLLTLALVSAVD